MAEETTRKKVLKAIQAEIVRTLTLDSKDLPSTIVMEVDECPLRGDLWFYEEVKRSQEEHEAFLARLKAD